MGGLVGHEEDNSGARALSALKVVAIDSEQVNRVFGKDSKLGCMFMRNQSKLLMMNGECQMERYLTAYERAIPDRPDALDL